MTTDLSEDNKECLVREYKFKGHSYKIVCVEDYPWHPSWHTHSDESIVREETWDIKPNDCVFDVGASFGSYTLTALAAGASKVFAWSPEDYPTASEIGFLRKSLTLNGWLDKCELFKYGIYSKPGWINAGTGQFFETEPVNKVQTTMRVVPFDSWFDTLLASGFDYKIYNNIWMKFDVEGAEVEVLKSAERAIAFMRPNIQVENHLFMDSTLADKVRELLTSWNYKEVWNKPYHSISHSVYKPLETLNASPMDENV